MFVPLDDTAFIISIGEGYGTNWYYRMGGITELHSFLHYYRVSGLWNEQLIHQCYNCKNEKTST